MAKAKANKAAKKTTKAKGSSEVTATGKIKIGGAGPAFNLPGSGGATITLKEFRGKKSVVLYFYPKDNTPGCTTEACEFRDQHAAFARTDAVVLGVSPDSLKKHDSFIEKFALPFILLADEEKKLIEKCGLWVLKKFMGREYMGVQRATILIGKNGKVVRIWSPVKPAGHAAEVLAALVRQR